MIVKKYFFLHTTLCPHLVVFVITGGHVTEYNANWLESQISQITTNGVNTFIEHQILF